MMQKYLMKTSVKIKHFIDWEEKSISETVEGH